MENIQGLSCGRTSPEPSRPTKGKISGQSSKQSAPSKAGGSCSYASKGKMGKRGNIVGDGFSLAWRVHRCPILGSPQRRKRIYLVADFAGRRAGKILFESEGVSGYSAEGFRAWQGAARHIEKGSGAAGGVRGVTCLCDQGGQRMDVMEDAACTLRAEAHHPPCVMDKSIHRNQQVSARNIPHRHRMPAIGEETPPTLHAGTGLRR